MLLKTRLEKGGNESFKGQFKHAGYIETVTVMLMV